MMSLTHARSWVSPRRALALALLLAAACGGEAPPPTRPVIGLMQVAAIAPLDDAKAGFLRALADSGYVADSTITIIERNAQGDIPTLSLIANEFKQRGVTHVAKAMCWCFCLGSVKSAMRPITCGGI